MWELWEILRLLGIFPIPGLGLEFDFDEMGTVSMGEVPGSGDEVDEWEVTVDVDLE